MNRRSLELFKYCKMCDRTNTSMVHMSDSGMGLVNYVGWCHDCRDGYSYKSVIEDVYDKENRI